MKNLLYIVFSIVFFGWGTFACTNDFDETNKNPNKIYSVTPQHVFPGIVHKTANYMAELNYKFFCWQSRYVDLWPSPKDNEDMSGIYRNIYVRILKDLEKLADAYVDTPGYENAGCMVLTWKAYIYSVLVSSWGGLPMSQAVSESADNTYPYDTEHEMYTQIFDLLDKAIAGFDPNGDVLKFDPLYRTANNTTDIARWRKFANTLRLDIALRAQNMDEEMAKTNIKKSLEHPEWLISSLDDIAKMKWGTDLNQDASYYFREFLRRYEDGTDRSIGRHPRINHYFYLYLKSYEDPRMAAYGKKAEGSNRFLVTNDTITRLNRYDSSLRDSIIVSYRIPYLPARELRYVPTGWDVANDPNSPGGTQKYSDPHTNTNDDMWMFINREFIKIDAASVILNWADACFMQAEVAVKYPNLIGGSAQAYYEQGIRASLAEYGLTARAEEYMNRPGIKWNTMGKGRAEYRGFYVANINGEGGDENHLEQIYKQRYIADFFNGHAGWTLERRSRALQYPPYFYNADVVNQGSNGICDFIPERLIYPRDEMNYNRLAYYAGVADLQKESPAPNPARWGDNFYTLLRIAKPNPQSLDKWNSGYIVYNADFVHKWYGATEEEMVRNAGKDDPRITSAFAMARLMGYRITKEISTYIP